jgi:hypothetical protein
MTRFTRHMSEGLHAESSISNVTNFSLSKPAERALFGPCSQHCEHRRATSWYDVAAAFLGPTGAACATPIMNRLMLAASPSCLVPSVAIDTVDEIADRAFCNTDKDAPLSWRPLRYWSSTEGQISRALTALVPMPSRAHSRNNRIGVSYAF